MKRNKYTVQYGDIDIHKGVTAFWVGVIVVVLVAIKIVSLFY